MTKRAGEPIWFSKWIRKSPWGKAQEAAGRKVLVNRSLGTAVKEAEKGPARESWKSPAGVVKKSFRPDAMSVAKHGYGGQVLELKPETWRGNTAKREAAVLKVQAEVAYLAAHGVQVKPAELILYMPEAAAGVPINGVVMDIDDSLYAVFIVAPDAGEAPGLVFYRLVGDPKLDPSAAPRWVRELAPKLSENEEMATDAAIAIAVGAGAAYAIKYIQAGLAEAGLALATEAVTSVCVPVVIMNPCILDPGSPGCREYGPAFPGGA